MSRYRCSSETQDNLDIKLKDSHKLSGPHCCVKLIQEGGDTAPSRERIKLDDTLREKIQARVAVESGEKPLCRICKTLVGDTYRNLWRYPLNCVLPDTPDGIAYHLRTL